MNMPDAVNMPSDNDTDENVDLFEEFNANASNMDGNDEMCEECVDHSIPEPYAMICLREQDSNSLSMPQPCTPVFPHFAPAEAN